MEQSAVIFGEMPKHRAEQLFNLAPDAFFSDPRCPPDLRHLMIQLLEQPYLRYMLSTRYAIPDSAYHFSWVGHELNDPTLRLQVLHGFNFAWHLMGPAWVMGFVRHMGLLFAGFFLAEAYDQFRITMYLQHIRPETNPLRMFSVIDDYLVTLFANMEGCFREEVSVDMIGRVLHFMNASVAQTKVICERTKQVSKHINHDYTVH